MGPAILSSTGAWGMEKAPKIFPDSRLSSALGTFQSAIIHSGKGGSSDFCDVSLASAAFRLTPKICPARRAKTENCWKR